MDRRVITLCFLLADSSDESETSEDSDLDGEASSALFMQVTGNVSRLLLPTSLSHLSDYIPGT